MIIFLSYYIYAAEHAIFKYYRLHSISHLSSKVKLEALKMVGDSKFFYIWGLRTRLQKLSNWYTFCLKVQVQKNWKLRQNFPLFKSLFPLPIDIRFRIIIIKWKGKVIKAVCRDIRLRIFRLWFNTCVFYRSGLYVRDVIKWLDDNGICMVWNYHE